MKTKNIWISDLISIGIAGFSGALAIVTPYLVSDGYNPAYFDDASLFSLLSSAWEGLNPIPTMLIMIAAGVGLGFIKPQRWLILGLSSISLLITVAIVEMYISPTSHNLWPFEFVLYFIFIAAPALLGAWIGSKIKKRDNAT